MIKEGNTVPMMDSNGNRMNGSVLEVKDDIVVMDFNHPLAGETLHFSGEVIRRTRTDSGRDRCLLRSRRWMQLRLRRLR